VEAQQEVAKLTAQLMEQLMARQEVAQLMVQLMEQLMAQQEVTQLEETVEFLVLNIRRLLLMHVKA